MTLIISPIYRHRKGGVVMAGVVWCACVAALMPLNPRQRVLAAEPAAAAAVQEDIETGVRVAQILKDAQRKREAGQITEALADLRVANALIKKAKGAGHPDALPVLDMAGTLLLENGQIVEAQTPLGKAVAMRAQSARSGARWAGRADRWPAMAASCSPSDRNCRAGSNSTPRPRRAART